MKHNNNRAKQIMSGLFGASDPDEKPKATSPRAEDKKEDQLSPWEVWERVKKWKTKKQ